MPPGVGRAAGSYRSGESVLPSCALCNRSDPHRMIALMALWFGRHAGVPSDGGYFYLCPSCYAEHVEPNLEEVLNRLVEQHPFLHRLRPDHDVHQAMPPRQAGALPIAHEGPPAAASPSAKQPEAQPDASPVPPRTGEPETSQQPPDAAA